MSSGLILVSILDGPPVTYGAVPYFSWASPSPEAPIALPPYAGAGSHFARRFRFSNHPIR